LTAATKVCEGEDCTSDDCCVAVASDPPSPSPSPTTGTTPTPGSNEPGSVPDNGNDKDNDKDSDNNSANNAAVDADKGDGTMMLLSIVGGAVGLLVVVAVVALIATKRKKAKRMDRITQMAAARRASAFGNRKMSGRGSMMGRKASMSVVGANEPMDEYGVSQSCAHCRVSLHST
jgi:hypothetical protein